MNQRYEIYPKLETFTERLIYAFDNQPLSQSKVAKAVSKDFAFSQPTLSDLLSGKIKSTKRAKKLAEVLKVDSQWLITGIASTENNEATTLVNIPLLEGFDKYVNTKSRVQIKHPESHIQLDVKALRNRDVNYFSARYIPMTDKGLGMLINEDSPVFFDTEQKLIEDGSTYVISHGGIIQVRQLFNLPMGSIKVQALNPVFDTFTLDVPQQSSQMFEVLGMVFAVVNYYL